MFRSGPVAVTRPATIERVIIAKRRGRIKKMRKYGKGEA
jgi:hypothetical protein